MDCGISRDNAVKALDKGFSDGYYTDIANDLQSSYDLINHIDNEFNDCSVINKLTRWPCPECGCLLDESMPYCPCCDI